MDIGKKIKEARLKKGMTQEELGASLGIQKSAVAKYENGRVVNIKLDTLRKISEILEINVSELVPGFSPWDMRFPFPELKSEDFKVRYVSSGVTVLEKDDDSEETFTIITVQDNSLSEDRIMAGDFVLVRKQSVIRDGEIAAVQVDGNEPILRRFFYYPKEDKLVLSPSDRYSAPLVFVGDEINSVEIIGKAISFQSNIF